MLCVDHEKRFFLYQFPSPWARPIKSFETSSQPRLESICLFLFSSRNLRLQIKPRIWETVTPPNQIYHSGESHGCTRYYFGMTPLVAHYFNTNWYLGRPYSLPLRPLLPHIYRPFLAPFPRRGGGGFRGSGWWRTGLLWRWHEADSDWRTNSHI